jgi:dATP/dGTP diphosphohydrolase
VSLPTDPKARKAVPIATGCLDYFPDALIAVAECSRAGNEQHHPGKPLHWDRSKSTDESDALIRHFMERGTVDTDGVRHSAKVAWRALALLQKEIEAGYSGDPSPNSPE